MDQVYIEGLAVQTLIGVYEFEREALQPLILDLTLEFDCAPAAASDDLQQALDYDQLSRRIVSWSAQQTFALIERYAQQLCDMIHREFGIQSMQLKVNKPEAVAGCSAVGITIQRRYL